MNPRVLWMAASVAAVVFGVRADALIAAACYGAAAGYCFKKAA